MFEIFLDEEVIGYIDKLILTDINYGAYQGKINFLNHIQPYEFIRYYCQKNQITINSEDVEFKLIATQVIPNLKVVANKQALNSRGIYIEGMQEEGYVVEIVGLADFG